MSIALGDVGAEDEDTGGGDCEEEGEEVPQGEGV